METVFLKLVNMTITASWLVIAVIIARLLLKKAPKWIAVLMWGLVGIRLILPFSLESAFSLIPSAETIPKDILYTKTPTIHSGVVALNSVVNPIISKSLAPVAIASVNPMQVVAFIASIVWIAGMIIMFIYTISSYLIIQSRVREAVPFKDNIWICDHVDTPFILGVIRPKIFLPSAIQEQDMKYVIAHENAHLKRRDHWWKPLGFLLLTVYWFNPVLWIAYILLCIDIELACDEKVIQDLGTVAKKLYSDALINCSVSKKMIAACPLAFGEVGVKKRVKSILNYKKPAFWVILLAISTMMIISVFFLTNPSVSANESNPPASTINGSNPSTSTNISYQKKLTLDDVTRLSQKGKSLKWSDFADYSYYETGSGLYIRVYEIDDMFELSIGGSNPNTLSAMYYYLSANDGSEHYVDIQKADIEAFIDEHKDNPVVERIFYDSLNVCLVDDTGSNFNSMLQAGASAQNLEMSNIQHLPAIKISSTAELKRFITQMNKSMNFDSCYIHTPSFNVISKQYTDEYFENNTLILAYAYMEADQYRIDYITKSQGVLSVGIVKSEPTFRDLATQGWLVCIDIQNYFQLEDIKSIDAHISSVEYRYTEAENAELLYKYVFKESKEVMKPSVSLYNNGVFTFSFSIISSYFGMGQHVLDDERLTLKTDDGKYVYCFDVIGDSLVFNADNSSDNLWFSDITDGAVFK